MPCPSPCPGLAKAASPSTNAARTTRRAVRVMSGLSSYLDGLLPVEHDGLGTGELRRRAGSVLVLRVIAVALRGDRQEGEPDAIAARDLLARLVLRVARVASLTL